MSMFQPFEPDEPNGGRRPARPPVPLRAVLPNLVTLLALAAGLTSIRMTVEHRFEMAILLILLAAALDAIDGRIARFLKSTSRFGAELDSIADFVDFGVAPAVLVYAWSLGDMHSLGWIAVLIYSICAALRLARFNVSLDSPDRRDWHAAFFVGVPAPAGAIVLMLPLYLEFVAIPHGYLTAPVTFVYTIAVGLLMVSRIPTWSGKLTGRRIAREMVAPLFVAGVLIVALLVSFPWETLTVLTVAYGVSLPFSWSAFMRRKRRDEAERASGAEAKGPGD